jgi:hypothetical protein
LPLGDPVQGGNSQNLGYLRAIVAAMVRQPAPDRLLEGEEALRWAAQFPVSRVTGAGERVGILRNGVVAVNKLASALAKTQPRYRRGAHPQNLAKALVDASIQAFSDRTAASIGSADLSVLERAVSEWFLENVKPRTCLIPCWIIPDIPSFAHAHPFAVGPVEFCHVSILLKQEGIGNPEKNIVYGPLFQAMDEREATWVAKIKIDDCEETRASEMADLAVDVALVGVQMVIPKSYSRDMARITGRTMPTWIGGVHKSGSQTTTTIRRRDPGFGLSGEAFDQFLSQQAALIKSVGRRVNAYVQGGVKLPSLEQAWCDGAYWFHEGLAEPLDTIAVAKLETAIEVLLGAESAKLSKERLCQAIQAFYGLKQADPLGTDPSISVKKFVESIVGARSRILHGTFSTLTENVIATRANVELLSFDLLRLSTVALGRYTALEAPVDTAKAFLDWVDKERQFGASS